MIHPTSVQPSKKFRRKMGRVPLAAGESNDRGQEVEVEDEPKTEKRVETQKIHARRCLQPS
jgi:hypothetical protein